jgi:all-trans-retinol 13,14-reductase
MQKTLDISLAEVVRKHLKSPKLISIIYAHCVLHGVHPEDVPFGLHSLLLDSFLQSAFGFKKGGDALAQSYVIEIERLGGVVHLGTGVSKLETKEKNIHSIHTECGKVFEAEWVISGIHPKPTFRLLDSQDFSPAFQTRLNGLDETRGIFGIYAECEEPIPFKQDKNYYYFDSSDPNDVIPLRKEARPPGPVFICRPDRVPREGKRTIPLSVLAQGPMEWFEPWKNSHLNERPKEYMQKKEELAESILYFIDTHKAGFRKQIRRFVSSTTLTNLHFNGSEGGSPYGIYHSIKNTGARAIGPRTHIRNLLLTGQSSLFPGLMGAATAGLRTAGHIIGIKPLIAELEKRKNFSA